MRAQRVERCCESGCVNIASVDADTLVPAPQMRRGKGAGSNACVLQQMLAHQRHGALALGTCDVNALQLSVWIANSRKQIRHRYAGKICTLLVGPRVGAHTRQQQPFDVGIVAYWLVKYAIGNGA